MGVGEGWDGGNTYKERLSLEKGRAESRLAMRLSWTLEEWNGMLNGTNASLSSCESELVQREPDDAQVLTAQDVVVAAMYSGRCK